MPLRRGWLVVLLALAWAATVGTIAPTAAQNLARGQILDDVKCADDSTESYSLYLPSTYSPDRPWPLLMGFHPGARGRAIVEKYRGAAEQYGYIVAGSNNSRNGSWEISAHAVTAMSRDLNQRFAVDGTRVYLTGHSGGARVAMEVALGKNRIAGVIASSAGFPDSQPRASVPFVVFGTAGTQDFNYIEMRLLDRTLKTPHRLVIFQGGHTLPPDDVAMDAVEWLELQAMKSGLRPKDETFITRLWEKRQALVTQSGESASTVHALGSLVDDFKGLRDVTSETARASALSQRSDVKRALTRERDSDNIELRLLGEFSQLEAGLADDARRNDSLAGLRTLLADLSKKANSAKDELERDRSRRVLSAITIGAAERVHDSDYLALLQRYRLPGSGRGGATDVD